MSQKREWKNTILGFTIMFLVIFITLFLTGDNLSYSLQVSFLATLIYRVMEYLVRQVRKH